MQKINGKRITFTKGDTFKALITMNTDTGTYIPVEGDLVRFAMKKDYTDSTALILKTIPNDTQILTIDSGDTESLEVGEYVYDIQITYANGDVDTFIDRGTLELTEEVS